ncbi:DinB family protein [Deinococcus deserti]|uniref:Putative DinB family protein n=1 Tax=Deinococcus deserti (strain DSM 17065 / CIP 109153 / LMG 22923 / VCD115) TaxID=546414 RepID=C1CYK8_DEIDV|nr:DinB family protein [Deinococcus deserti]ACO45029.1 putative DinB family protein [Deinococcus deserti VCD115]
MPVNPAETYARNFLMHRGALMDLYAQLPEDQGTFSAWEGGMTFIGLADHLSGSCQRLLSMVAGEKPGAVASSATLQEARGRLETTGEQIARAIRAMGPEDLERRVVAFGGREMPAAALLDAMVSHEAHHKGQVWMMARMLGIKPPMYIKMG